MQYKLINVNRSDILVEIYDPKPSYKNRNLNRIGPMLALTVKGGSVIDLLPYFNGSLEECHNAVRYSKEIMKCLRPNMLRIYVCDNAGNKIDVDALLNTPKIADSEPKKKEDTLKPQENAPPPRATTPTVELSPDDSTDMVEPSFDDTMPYAEGPDDLTTIKGIGKTLQQKLIDEGYDSYAKIASADPQKIKKVTGWKTDKVINGAKELLGQ